jgi:hypothetical protein
MTGKFWLDLFCVIAFIVGTLIISVYGFVILTILVYLAKYWYIIFIITIIYFYIKDRNRINKNK